MGAPRTGERKRPALGWESLTPTEEKIVALATEGLTNPQIGERLFISRTTVKTHLEHVYSKLGATAPRWRPNRRGATEAQCDGWS